MVEWKDNHGNPVCPHCGTEFRDELNNIYFFDILKTAQFCPECGKKIAVNYDDLTINDKDVEVIMFALEKLNALCQGRVCEDCPLYREDACSCLLKHFPYSVQFDKVRNALCNEVVHREYDENCLF